MIPLSQPGSNLPSYYRNLQSVADHLLSMPRQNTYACCFICNWHGTTEIPYAPGSYLHHTPVTNAFTTSLTGQPHKYSMLNVPYCAACWHVDKVCAFSSLSHINMDVQTSNAQQSATDDSGHGGVNQLMNEYPQPKYTIQGIGDTSSSCMRNCSNHNTRTKPQSHLQATQKIVLHYSKSTLHMEATTTSIYSQLQHKHPIKMQCCRTIPPPPP